MRLNVRLTYHIAGLEYRPQDPGEESYDEAEGYTREEGSDEHDLHSYRDDVGNRYFTILFSTIS